MASLFGLFSVFSVSYAIILTMVFLTKGLGQVVWAMLLLFCFSYNFGWEVNPVTDMYVINETLVPVWIFHPMNLLGGLILALIVSISIRLWGSENER